MPEWLLLLATQAGTALAQAAASDGWQHARNGIVRLFGRGGQRRQVAAQRWVDQTAAEIEQAPTEQQAQLRERLASTWQQRLADLIEEYPELGPELRAWVQEVHRQLPTAQQIHSNTFIARDDATQYISQGGSITVTHQYGPAGPTA
ncbi:hypothetical protein O7626_24620 [Micromonospora sp. WMMD1102]|uniref:hypothetical protein n=1 Tax=Micromonospora sp. WMMD1102 TaxID=3016105 RepID=UPI002415194B|nr:hypothetical protein [Micromonospora sp. WMMD1102]MDG4789076.1 hypothetical protein [Micromonospora sp. WMMD1102]